MTCHSQDLLRSWQLVYELLVKARTQVNVVLDKTALGPFLYFYLGFGWNSTLKEYYVLSQLKKRLLLDTTGFGGTLTEEDSMEKHLLPTLSKMTNQSLFLLLPRHTVIDDTRRTVTSRYTRLQAIRLQREYEDTIPSLLSDQHYAFCIQ